MGARGAHHLRYHLGLLGTLHGDARAGASSSAGAKKQAPSVEPPVKRARAGGGINARKEDRVRTWNMQELEVLEDSWHPQRADGARAAAEEAALRAHAAGGPSAAWAASEAPARPRSNTVGRDSKGAGGGAKAAGVAGKSAEIKRDDSQSPVAGRPSAGSTCRARCRVGRYKSELYT